MAGGDGEIITGAGDDVSVAQIFTVGAMGEAGFVIGSIMVQDIYLIRTVGGRYYGSPAYIDVRINGKHYHSCCGCLGLCPALPWSLKLQLNCFCTVMAPEPVS